MRSGVKRMDCAFCTEFAQAGNGERIIARVGDWVLLPTLGCFIPGYCLLMPLAHVNAIADLPLNDLEMVEIAMERFRVRLEAVYGPVIIAEHGPRDCELGAGCCSHAHLHLIPVPNPHAVTAAYQATGGNGASIPTLAGLPELVNGAYVYLSSRPHEHYIWPATSFARQFVRHVCATLHGMGDRYDWRDHAFTHIQRVTLDHLRTVFAATNAT